MCETPRVVRNDGLICQHSVGVQAAWTGARFVAYCPGSERLSLERRDVAADVLKRRLKNLVREVKTARERILEREAEELASAGMPEVAVHTRARRPANAAEAKAAIRYHDHL